MEVRQLSLVGGEAVAWVRQGGEWSGVQPLGKLVAQGDDALLPVGLG